LAQEVAVVVVAMMPVMAVLPAASSPGVSAAWLSQGPPVVRTVASGHWVRASKEHRLVSMSAVALTIGCIGSRQARRGSVRTVRIWQQAASTEASAAAVKKVLKQKEAAYRQKQAQSRGQVNTDEVPVLADCPRTAFVGDDGLLQVPAVQARIRASVYAVFAPDETLQYVGVSRNSQASLRAHFVRIPELCGHFAVYDLSKPFRALLEAVRESWTKEMGMPVGNDGGDGQAMWESPLDVQALATESERAELDGAAPAEAQEVLKELVRRVESAQAEKFVECGCSELLVFDGKLKAKGLLDLDLSAPVGTWLPEGGAGVPFELTLRSADGSEAQIDCTMDMTILEAAEEAGIELPASCKSGACSACAAKVLEGEVNQADQAFLDDDQVSKGYVLTCVCYPRSNLVLETDKQRDVA